MQKTKPNPYTNNQSTSRILKRVQMVLYNIETIRNNTKKLSSPEFDLFGYHEEEEGITSLSEADLEMLLPKSNAKVPSYHKYLTRLYQLGKFDPQVFHMSMFLMRRFIENISPYIKLEPYVLKLFCVIVMISHKLVMDVTWKLKDLSKILGFGKNSLQKMELFLYRAMKFKICYGEKEVEETERWLDRVDELLNGEKNYKN